MSDLILSEEEIVAVTKKRRHSSQVLVLRMLGIHHKIRPDGTIIVSRTHFDDVMGPKASRRKAVESEPDWSAAA
jgi:hypothetical protein